VCLGRCVLRALKLSSLRSAVAYVPQETLLFGMMLPSGNDAAEQVAVSLAGSREQYVGWMNDRVAALHLRDTHFVTPSGMDADEHYSSAYDVGTMPRTQAAA